MKYTIKKGDTLTSLAKRFGTSVSAIAKANGIADPDKIYAGDSLAIPGKAKPKIEAKPQTEAKPKAEFRQGLLAADPEMFDPQTQALQGSYPEMLAMGIPGLMRGLGTSAGKGLLTSQYRNIPAWLNNPATQGVMKQNPTRTLNDLSKAAVANEAKFTIGGSQAPEMLMLERLIAAQRFQ